jgi:hypothetical protein
VEVAGVSGQQTVTMFRDEEKHKEAIKGKQQFDWPCSMNATNADGHTAVAHACNWNSGSLFFCLRLESDHRSSGILFRYVSQGIIFKIKRNLKKAHSARGDQAIRIVVCPIKSLLL